MAYQLLKCPVCGAAIPVHAKASVAECRFCQSQFSVKRVHGSPSPELGWLLAAFALGFIVGWPTSRALLAATAKTSIGELEKRVAEWGKGR